MVSLSQINKKYGKYLQHPIEREHDGDGYVYFAYLKKPYVFDGNQSVWSEDNLEDLDYVLKNYVEEDEEWWKRIYPNE